MERRGIGQDERARGIKVYGERASVLKWKGGTRSTLKGWGR
jgi:hypothetical protein